MISNQLSNNLRFSLNNCTNNDKIGILNQNPLIITKSEAFSFNYTDPDRLKYAQLLAKRDIQNLKSVESIKEIPVAVIKPQDRCKKATTGYNITKKNKSEERVSSIKRVPGPQTPSKVSTLRRVPPSILKKSGMPPRSMSPPVKDTDISWRPKEEVQVVNKLQSQMDQCTNKLDNLERMLREQSLKIVPQATLSFPKFTVPPNKSKKDLQVLEEKLRSLVECASPRERHSARDNVPPVDRQPYTPLPRVNLPIDNILTKLDCLASEMDSIRARWTSLPYETVSVCGDNDDDDGKILDTFRFTKAPERAWMEVDSSVEDRRMYLNVPGELVARLDSDRNRFSDSVRFPLLAKHQLSPTRAGEWFSEDIVSEVVEEVIKEFDDTSGELVEAILNDELTN